MERFPMKKQNILSHIGIGVCLIVSIISVVVMYIRGIPTEEAKECFPVSIKGEYSTDDGKTFIAFDDVNRIKSFKSDRLIIKGTFDRVIPAGEMVHLFLSNAYLELYVDGTAVFKENSIEDNPWKNFITQSAIGPDNEVRIEMTIDKHHSFNRSFQQCYKSIYYGSKYGLLKTMLLNHVVQILGCVLIATLGFAVLMNRMALRNEIGVDTDGMISLAMVLITGAMTCFIDYDYITLINPNYFALKYVDSLTQAFSVIVMSLNLVRYLLRDETKRLCLTVIGAMGCLTAVFILCQMIFNPDAQQSINLFGVMIFVGAILIGMELVVIFINFRDMPRKNKLSFNSSLALVGSAMFEMLYFVLTGEYLVYVLMFTLMIFTIIQYYLILKNNTNNLHDAQKTYALEQELTESQIRMMLSQIQPHFLYNAIGTIRALCTKNPQEARTAMDHFAKYLRANMDSLNERWCIPFTKELEHVKSYLYIEKLRFGDRLEVEYDIQATDFVIPPLALQTMVENAVKHGLLPKKDGGTVKISTRENEDIFELVISDNGVGFDQTKQKPDDGRSHIGITNTRQRIMGMCNGSLNIGSLAGEGTTITILLPKMANSNR